MVKLQNIKKSFIDANKKLEVLKDVNLDIHQGEFVYITGASGCGKSTLLHLIGLLDKPSSGSLSILNKSVSSIKSVERFRNINMGFVFQSHFLLEDFTALENIMIPLLIQNVSKKEAKERALNMLKIIGLEDRKNHLPRKLSGGEEQRIAIARAIVTNPKILIADEPTGNLDQENSLLVMDLIRKLNSEGLTVVLVTHDLSLPREVDSHYTLIDGKLNKYEKKK